MVMCDEKRSYLNTKSGAIMDNEHPKAVAAREMRERNHKTRSAELERITNAKRQHNVRFLTVGKYTICYRVDRRDVIELSTTIKHPNDCFDKHIGQMQALERFINNNRIHLKNEQSFPPKQFLQLAFSVFQ